MTLYPSLYQVIYASPGLHKTIAGDRGSEQSFYALYWPVLWLGGPVLNQMGSTPQLYSVDMQFSGN